MPSAVGSERRAAVIGAGFAGLTAAAALAMRGWSVILYERGSAIRAVGSALALSENGLSVLEAVGAYEDAVKGAFPLQFRETRDGANRLLSRYDWKSHNKRLRMYFLLRSRAIESLADAARRQGVQVLLGKTVTGVEADGTVHGADNTSERFDLVIGADGANSAVRASLSIPWTRTLHAEGSIRLLLDSDPSDSWEHGLFVEYWSGIRRAMLVPCSEDKLYLALIARADDPHAKQVPIDKAVWSASFPHLAPFIQRLGEQDRWSWDQYQTIRMRSWTVGRVALIGDAAHAMSPNFGQGAALAMVNGITLAAAVATAPDITAALQRWESKERWLTDRTQRLSALYSNMTTWPQALRAGFIWAMGKSSWIMKQRTLAAHYLPVEAMPRMDARRASENSRG